MSDVTQYSSDTCVKVYPFTRQPGGDEIVIGRPDLVVFLALPPDAVEILDNLATGKTVGEAQLLYQEKYGEVPDVGEFLALLEEKGFVQPLPSDAHDQLTTPDLFTTPPTTGPQPPPIRYHFANFPQRLAEQIFSPIVLIACILLISVAVAMIVAEPKLIPGWDAFFFRDNLTLMRLSVLLMGYLALFLHEMAHLVAARAVGVSSRMGISHRLWFLVAETDMTGIWSVPRNRRYLPFLAGSLLDAVSAAILIVVVFGTEQGWFKLDPIVFRLVRAMLLTYLLSLLWQCYLFVRTDFYYVIAAYFNCKNLMSDTETFLRNQLSKITRRGQRRDQSHIPAAEMSVIPWYAVVWIVGRGLAIGTLIVITIPLFYNYIVAMYSKLSAGYSADPYGFVDALVLGSFFVVRQSAGFVLWIRSSQLTRRLPIWNGSRA